MTSTDGEPVSLSDYHGYTVWLFVSGVSGVSHVVKSCLFSEQMYEKYKDKGFVVLGFNPEDNRKIAMDFLRMRGITFPNIIEPSEALKKTCYQDYQNVGGAVPLNYLISGDGRIVEGWFGYRPGDPRLGIALEKTSGELAEALRQEWETTAQQSAESVTAAWRNDYLTPYGRLTMAVSSIRMRGPGFCRAVVSITRCARTIPAGFVGRVAGSRDDPIAEVHLGKVFAGRGGMPSVYYELQLRNAEVLRGTCLSYQDPQAEQWIGYEGLDWHLQEDP